MKKLAVCLLVGIVLLMFAAPTAQAGEGRGGFMGFLAGCCLGVRTGMDYNAGQEIHWRDWGPLIPYAGFVISIWNGLDCYDGLTRAEMAAKYGSTFY